MAERLEARGAYFMANEHLRTETSQRHQHLEGLAGTIRKNLTQQFELAIVLRRLSSRFKHGSTEYDILRMVSRGARQRATKLRDLLRKLDGTLPKYRKKEPGFLVRYRLSKLIAPRLVIALVSLFGGSRVRGWLFEAVYPWKRRSRRLPKPRI
jgi:hypothetical protein